MQELMPFDATDWYWAATDGRIFASARCVVVAAGDAGYAAFLAAGNAASAWPVDGTGAQTMDALGDMLAHYGLATTMAATLIAYASAKQLALRDGGITVNVGSATTQDMIDVATDADGRDMVAGNVQYIGLCAQAGQTAPTFNWINDSVGSTPGTQVTLTATQMMSLGLTLRAFVQATYDALGVVNAAIAAGSITSKSGVDAAAWPATTY